MCDILYIKADDSEDSDLNIGMQKSIVPFLTILQSPFFTSKATDTQLILSDTHEKMKLWVENNTEGFLIQKKFFRDFITWIQYLQSRIDRLEQ